MATPASKLGLRRCEPRLSSGPPVPKMFLKMEKLKLICLQYAAATQWLITSSIDIPKSGSLSNASTGIEKFWDLKLRNQSKKLNLSSGESSVIESILNFEREFTAELQSLRPILSSSA